MYLVTYDPIKLSILKGHVEDASLQQLHIVQIHCLLLCLAQHPLIQFQACDLLHVGNERTYVVASPTTY